MCTWFNLLIILPSSFPVMGKGVLINACVINCICQAQHESSLIFVFFSLQQAQPTWNTSEITAELVARRYNEIYPDIYQGKLITWSQRVTTLLVGYCPCHVSQPTSWLSHCRRRGVKPCNGHITFVLMNPKSLTNHQQKT